MGEYMMAFPTATADATRNDTHKQGTVRSGATEIRDPVFILAAPRSFSSVVCAMLGQHPQMYGLPETHLFGVETMAEWLALCSRATYDMDHGLVRAVAELYFGEQTESTVKLARGWLRRRSHFSTGYLFELLAQSVHGRILAEKSPSIVYEIKYMQRARSMFPEARFIHLVRHPRGYGESVLNYLRDRRNLGPTPKWLPRLASFSPSPRRDGRISQARDIDPQRGWYALNMNVCDFLKSLREDQSIRVRGEDLLTEPDSSLHRIAAWIGLCTGLEAVEEMKHPERSPYAHLGPLGARFGNDRFFLRDPVLRPNCARLQSLKGPLAWREDGQGFSPEVKELAGQFGYE
jgi:hypothetical protein